MITFSQLGNYGRFGNQLFQIASTIGIALKNGHDYIFPMWKYSEYFSYPLPHLNFFGNIEYIDEKFQIIEETSSGYTEFNLQKNKNYDLKGYFQSYKYFGDYKEIFLKYFELNREYTIIPNDNVISIHVRRGDYINLQHIHPILEFEYYKKAMEHFPNDSTFLVFSDDMPWCRKNFRDKNFLFIEDDLIKEFSYMKNCKYNIIANSSLSWWAAYLNPNPNKIIIAPKVYVLNEKTDDRIPKEWIRI